MSQGTLYSDQRIRSIVPAAIVKHFNLDVKIVAPANDAATFKKYFPTERVPAFVGPKGLKLTEVIAVSIYCMLPTASLMRLFHLLQLSLS